MAMTSYMTIKGKNQGDIQGDCNQQGRENTIIVYGMDHQVEIPRDPHTGLATGQRIHGAFKVETHMGKQTPKVFQACCTGEHMDVEIQMFHINEKGQEEKYFTIKLQNAIVVDSREWYPETFVEENKPYRHMQDILFTYETITWTDNVNSIEAQDSWTKPVTG